MVSKLRHVRFPETELHRSHDVLVLGSHDPPIKDSVVLFCLDGQFLQFEQRRLDGMLSQIPMSVLLIGIASQPDIRSKEYIPWNDSPLFAAHESFVTETLVPWVRKQYCSELSREKTGIFGFSNGAVSAMTLGLRHRQLFGSIVALSLVGSPDQYTDDVLLIEPRPQIHLAAGSREKPLCKKSERLSRRLDRLKVRNRFEVRQGAGHETSFWAEELGHALRWLFLNHTDI